jgi:hypothetical protein
MGGHGYDHVLHAGAGVNKDENTAANSSVTQQNYFCLLYSS